MSSELLLALAVGYLLGSIPFGLVLTRLAGKGDVRDIGSGNIGATNVLRTGSKVLAAATLVLDCLKATAAILLVRRLWPDFENFAAAGALIAPLILGKAAPSRRGKLVIAASAVLLLALAFLEIAHV